MEGGRPRTKKAPKRAPKKSPKKAPKKALNKYTSFVRDNIGSFCGTPQEKMKQVAQAYRSRCL